MIRLISIYLVFLILSGNTTAQTADWEMYRGHNDLSGRTLSRIPEKPVLLWSKKTNSRSVSSPVISEGSVYFANNDGTVFALNSRGDIRWQFDAGTAIEAAPLILDKLVIFGCLDGDVRALDKTNGKLVWQYETENQVYGSVNIWEDEGKKLIVFGSYDYYLHCIDPVTGRPQWKFETDNFIHGTPAVSGNKIIFGGCDGLLRVINPATGKEEDYADLGVYIASSPAVASNHAFVGSHEGLFFSVDLHTMTTAWEAPARDEYSVIMATPAINNNMVVVGSEDKYLYCYNAKDGKKRWEFRTGGRVNGSAVISEDKVLFGSRDGSIYILDLETGKELWSFDTGKAISSSPAITDEMFCILTEDGRLLAFGK